MGIFRAINMRKRTEQEAHPRRCRRQRYAVKKAAKGPAPANNVEDPEFFSHKLMKNKLHNPRNNIKLSVKNRKRQLKRLNNNKRDEQRKSGENKKGSDFVADLFMEDEEETAETETPAEATEMTEAASTSKSSKPSTAAASSSSAASSSTGTETTTTKKKNKRGGRKKNKGKGVAEGAGEDVEMEEA